jgi:hypothetical protein
MSNLVCASDARLKTISPTNGKNSDRGKKNLKYCSAFYDFEKTGNQRNIIQKLIGNQLVIFQKINWRSIDDLPEKKWNSMHDLPEKK